MPKKSEDIAREIVVLDDGSDLLPHVLGIDDNHLFPARGGLTLDDGKGR